MTDRNVYHVVPAQNQWSITQEGATVATFESKDQAIERGRQIALQQQPSQLVVHTADGAIEDERTYTNDPFPPEG